MSKSFMDYVSYITGKRVMVSVNLNGTEFDYKFSSPDGISDADRVLLESEASAKSQATLQTKILLG